MSNNNWYQNNQPGPTQVYPTAHQPYGYPQPFGQTPPPPNGSALAGFILSILSLGFLVPLFGWLAIPLVILGLVFSIIGLNKARNGASLRGLALAGIVIATISLVAGIIVNVLVYHSAITNWTHTDVVAVAPAGPQAEALVGEWAFEGNPWFRFNADGTGENLSDGERFNWHEDGTFSNALVYRSWHVDGDTLTVTWDNGSSFTYTRIVDQSRL